MTEFISYLLELTICAFLIIFLLFQLRKLWKMRHTLERFSMYLQTLDKQLKVLDSMFVKTDKNRIPSDGKLPDIGGRCEFCQNLRMYVPPKSDKIFIYRCELHNKEVGLTDGCKSFKKDLQNFKI